MDRIKFKRMSPPEQMIVKCKFPRKLMEKKWFHLTNYENEFLQPILILLISNLI